MTDERTIKRSEGKGKSTVIEVNVFLPWTE